LLFLLRHICYLKCKQTCLLPAVDQRTAPVERFVYSCCQISTKCNFHCIQINIFIPTLIFSRNSEGSS
jgi:hypothetical protein